MHIKLLKSDSDAWRNFLKENEHLIVHTPEWKGFIESTFPRTKAKYYAIANNLGKIKLIFPVFNTKFSFIPNVSSAFLEYGGPAGKATSKQFAELKKKLPRNLEIRQGVGDDFLKIFRKVQVAIRPVLQLKSSEDMWARIHKFKRKAVRLAEKSGISVRDVPENEISSLYNLYLKTMKNFGTPPYSKKYFINFYRFFVRKKLGKIIGAYYKGKLVAVLTGFTIGETVHVNINVSDYKYQNARPNDAIYWEFIKWSCDNGFKIFDFGSTHDDTHLAFKKKWNPEFQKLCYFYTKTAKPADSKSARLFFIFWKKIPISVARVIGPFIRESFGL